MASRLEGRVAPLIEEADPPQSLGTTPGPALDPRLQAMVQAGRYHGVELDPNEYRRPEGETAPSAASLSQWAANAGMWSRAVRIRWRTCSAFRKPGPSYCCSRTAAPGC